MSARPESFGAPNPRRHWSADHRCTDPACGHRRDQHREPLVRDGRCTIPGCLCFGWDPLTQQQWAAALRDQRRSRRLGCSVFTLALLAALADIAVLVILLAVLAAPRSAIIPTGSQPGVPGAIGSVDAPAQAQAAASGSWLIGAPPSGAWQVGARIETRPRPRPGDPEPGSPVAAGARRELDRSRWQLVPILPSEPASGAPPPERTTISSGWASWFPAAGDQAAVPWWRPGQDPVWAAVDRFADGKAYSVTVLITGFCECLSGQARERLIDLSAHAFAQLAPLSEGLIHVQVEIPTQGPALPATDGPGG